MTMSAGGTQTGVRHVRLSALVGRVVGVKDGQSLGKVKDVIVRLDLEPGHHPPVTGLVVAVDRRDLFVPITVVSDLGAETLQLSTARLDLRAFERRDGEILLQRDLLGHRLIDVDSARLVRAQDVELDDHRGWVLMRIELTTRGRLSRLLRGGSAASECRDWSEFEPLIGHDASAKLRAPFSRLRKLRPADLADLVEEATHDESEEILDAVGDDKELEADVIEELEPDSQVQVMKERSDDEVADVLAHMGPDDAADLLSEFPQERRVGVLEKLPAAVQAKIRSLLGFHTDTAGGMMTPDFLAVSAGATVKVAVDHVRNAASVSPEVLLTVYVLEGTRLVGAIGLPALLHADPATTLADAAEPDPVRVSPEAHITEVAVRMTDFNLVTIPVVDPDDNLLGVITVDDVLEATVPEEWWDRVEDVEAAPRRRRRQDPTRVGSP
jgi:CBS domain-containing protein/sporulation protein YlmC with PRC-barrel domain